MSLQVWLPLTKDTRQQGLSNISVTGSPASWGNGKLGKCATWNGAVANIIYNNTTDFNYTENFSVAMWINPIYTGSTAQYAFTVGRADAGGYGYGLQINSATQATFRFGNRAVSFSLASNEWNHVVMTVDTANVIVYKNGTQVAINTIATKPTYSDGNGMGLGCFHYSGNIYPYYGSLNDFRIYDHCLSPMEVKELAKGLILHYPLNRNGWGRENNIAVAKIANRSCSNFTYNSSTQEWTMTCPTGSSTWGYGIVINDRNIRWAVSETWVVSMEVYVPRAITWNCDINNKPDLEDISQYTGNDDDITGQRQVCTNGTKGSKSLQTGWNKIWFSQTANTTYGLTNYSTNWGIITTNESSAIDIKIRNIKGEVIEANAEIKPTAWCANVADGSNTNVEYDCSGFGNNGEKSGVFTYTSDKSKYALSTHIGTNTTKIHISNFPTSGFGNSYSFAWWGKRSDNGPMFWGFSDGVRLNGMYTGRLWNTGDSNNNPLYNVGTTTQVTAPSTNTWHHYVMTGNGTKCYVYLDGELWAEAKTYKAISGTSIWINGWDSGTSYCHTNCDMSDFRIYATALSASDVLSLYQNNAYIDDFGNIYGKIRN